jgi:hypothetical protein
MLLPDARRLTLDARHPTPDARCLTPDPSNFPSSEIIPLIFKPLCFFFVKFIPDFFFFPSGILIDLIQTYEKPDYYNFDSGCSLFQNNSPAC